MNNTTDTPTPKVWLGCLGPYNNGELVGFWIDATDLADTDEVKRLQAEALSKASRTYAPYETEEWEIFDHEGWAGYDPQGESYDDLATLAEHIEEHGEAFAAWLAEDATHAETPHKFTEAFRGEWDSAEDYCTDFLHETDPAFENGENGTLVCYFDYAAYTRDCLIGDIWEAPTGRGTVWIFLSNV